MFVVIMKFFLVAVIAVGKLWAAIPAGVAFKLHPIMNILASGSGSIIGVLMVVIIGNRFREWLLSKKGSKENTPNNTQKIWDKYGIVGLGLLSPILTGALFGTAIGITLGAEKNKLILWMSIGIIFWTVVLVYIATMGVMVFGYKDKKVFYETILTHKTQYGIM